MLVPITRETFEELIPSAATGAQYVYFWDGLQTCLKRVVGSLAGVFVVWLVSIPFHSGGLSLFLGITVGLYWLWAPVAKASWRNRRNRRYPYAGFWQGKILDVYVTEEVVGTEETANQYGELTIVENRERMLNLEVGDRTGFETSLQVPLQKQHRLLGAGLSVQMLVLSEVADLSSIAEISDVFVPSRNLWVSDYPTVRRDAFMAVGRQIGRSAASDRRVSRDRLEYGEFGDEEAFEGDIRGGARREERFYDERDERLPGDRRVTRGRRPGRPRRPRR
ncbi:MAG: phosphate ABC transporter permease [Geitlerinemataceae cyanobacterium]